MFLQKYYLSLQYQIKTKFIMKTKTQKQLVRQFLMDGNSITPLDALNKFGVFRLSAIIFDLRNEGMNIETEYVQNPNGKMFAKYSLIKYSLKKDSL